MEVVRLYPQYFTQNDRRKNTTPVTFERRKFERENQTASYSGPYELIEKAKNTAGYSKLKQDIDEVKDVFAEFSNAYKKESNKENDMPIGFINSIPFIRRFGSIQEAFLGHDYFKAAGKGFLQFINVKEDWRDILKIFKKSDMPNDYQVPFSFIRGTFLEKFKCMKKIRKKLDFTIYDTNLAQCFLRLFGKNEKVPYFTGKFDKFDNPIMGYMVDGKIPAKVFGRTLMRIPILGLLFLSLLELPSIIKEENHVKQIAKSAINISSFTLGGAFLGAVGAYLGPLGSLVGIGVGSYLGNKFAKKLNNKL